MFEKNTSTFNMSIKASVIIRTYNEERHLDSLLGRFSDQSILNHEIIIVDSGSTDRTLKIAEAYGCKILHIDKSVFSFGRSLNVGCEAARGEYLAFVSGHCIPTDGRWLEELIAPFHDEITAYVYGRQTGNESSNFSEKELLAKYFPNTKKKSKQDFFCNNANAALRRNIWEKYRFDEDITGLEDMFLAKMLVKDKYRVIYNPNAVVYHLHDEGWKQIKRRYEREAIALQYIMPEIHITFVDSLRYYLSAVFLDIGSAIQKKCLIRIFWEILYFRSAQFYGSYVGNHELRKTAREMKEQYFYPK